MVPHSSVGRAAPTRNIARLLSTETTASASAPVETNPDRLRCPFVSETVMTSNLYEIPPDAGRSWWLRDALADEPGEPAPPLRGDITADVVILGAGYTGMWTALHLTELDPGLDVVILEQDIAGGGASGRNGGFVNSFWGDLEYLARRFGDRPAIELCEAGEESVRALGAFCDEHGIDAWYRADGEYVVAASEDQF